jgi:hypothetical protein
VEVVERPGHTFAELGRPVDSDDYALCVYDAHSQPLLQDDGAGGRHVRDEACWKQLGPPAGAKGYKYKDVDGLPTDLDVMDC